MAELPDVIQSHISRVLERLYTSIPAIVTDVSKLESDNVVSVQPAIDKVTSDGFSYPMAEIPDVPVQWPAGGGAVLTFPIAKGDDVLLTCSMTSISEWWLVSSGSVKPFDTRKHDMADSFVIPSIFRKANNPAPSKDDVVLKYGGHSITLEKAGGDIVISTSANAVVNCTQAIINGDTIMNGNLTVDGTIDATGDITTDTNVSALGTVTGVTNVIAGITPATVAVLTHTHYAADNVTPLTGTPILTP